MTRGTWACYSAVFQIDPLIRLFFLIEACWQLQPPTCGHQWSLTNNLWLQVPTAQSSFHQTGFVLFERFVFDTAKIVDLFYNEESTPVPLIP